MVDVAKVRMFGDYIGTFVWDDSYKLARFEYDNDFIGKGIEPSPLMMPVQQGRIYSFGNLNWDTFNGLPGMLANSLPDTYGRALFDKWLTLTGRKTNRKGRLNTCQPPFLPKMQGIRVNPRNLP